METTANNRRYVERWFWTLDALAQSVGSTPDEVAMLIAAGCAPGPIYVQIGGAEWWSALGGTAPPPPGETWYAPGAAWGLRRAILGRRGGATPAQAAAANRARFVRDFVAEVGRVDGAARAFPRCFVDGQVDGDAAAIVAGEEWGSWIAGGYGVCLGVFSAATCIAKESLGAAIKAALAKGDGDTAELLDQAEALAGLILPFAPWQRPVGTPGRTIDRLLDEQRLGRERPYD
jgi:hypothetical protein